MTVTRKWSLLAALLVLAIVAAGWFLLIAPKRSEASDLRTKTLSQNEANDRLTQQISVLKAQQAELPAQRARLAVLKTRIPENPALPTLIRSLTSAGRKVGATIDTMSPAVPVAVVSAAPVTPVAPPVEATTTEPSDSAPPAAPAPVVAAPAAASLYEVPLTLSVSGSYFELEQFVNRLEGLKRSFRVTGFTLGTASGQTATAGDLSITLQGQVFMSPSVTVVPAPITPVAAAPAAQ